MFGIGPSEMVVIAVLFLLVFGPSKLPEMARDIGGFVGQARGVIDEFKDELTLAGEPTDKPGEDQPGDNSNEGTGRQRHERDRHERTRQRHRGEEPREGVPEAEPPEDDERRDQDRARDGAEYDL